MCSGRKQAATGDAWGSQVSCSFLFGWVAVRQNRSWGGLHALLVLSALFAVKPAYNVLPSHTHTASSDIKKVLVLDQLQAPPCHWLRTIWKSRAAQAFATTIDWRSDGVSNRRSTRKLDRRLSGTRTRVRVAESCGKRPTASRWWTRRSLKWSRCMRKLGKFQFAGGNGVVDTIQNEADEKTPLPDSKIRPIVPAWNSDSTVKPQCQGSCRCFHALSAKAGATFPWFCLRVMSREEISMPAKICLSKINWFVSEHRQLSLLTIASRYYHEFKQKLFDVVNYSVR